MGGSQLQTTWVQFEEHVEEPALEILVHLDRENGRLLVAHTEEETANMGDT